MIALASVALVAVVFFAALAIAQRVLASDSRKHQLEMDASLNALRDMGGKRTGSWHGGGYF